MAEINDYNAIYGLIDSEPDDLTYFPNLRRSCRHTAGVPPKWFGNANVWLVTDSLISMDKGNVPYIYEEAIDSSEAEKWKRAMEDEIKSLNENQFSNLVQLPEGRKSIKTKWVFDLKVDSKEVVIRHKARLVGKGFSQREGERTTLRSFIRFPGTVPFSLLWRFQYRIGGFVQDFILNQNYSIPNVMNTIL